MRANARCGIVVLHPAPAAKTQANPPRGVFHAIHHTKPIA